MMTSSNTKHTKLHWMKAQPELDPTATIAARGLTLLNNPCSYAKCHQTCTQYLISTPYSVPNNLPTSNP